MTNFKRYTKQLSILSIIIALITAAMMFYGPKDFVSPALPYILSLLIASSFLIGKFLIAAIEVNFQKFSPRFMGITFSKMMLSITIIGIYAFMNKADAIAFVINYTVLYFIFTIFEIKSLLRISNSQRENQS
jgi:hypothetical protein